MEQDFEMPRKKMIEQQLKVRNIQSQAVLDAMLQVPRHLFVPVNLQNSAYNDCPLPIGKEQTISQPYIVAFMSEQLKTAKGMKILEIGTGSGYQAAILSCLGCEVYTIELIEELAQAAQYTLSNLKYDTVRIRNGNGFSGWPEEAPFDRIIVTAAPPAMPLKLIEQLKEDGSMIIPIGPVYNVQILKCITKKDHTIIEKDLIPVRFVPMVDTLF